MTYARTPLFLAAVALLSVLPGCSGAASSARPTLDGAVRPEWGSPQPGDRAPDFELPIVGGNTFRLSSLQGSWVFLHFTASWCPFCDAEVKHLGEVAEQYGARGVKVVLVDVKEPLAHWSKYASEHVAPSVVDLYDATGATAARYAPPRMQPSFQDRAEVVLDSSLLIDRQGTIRLFVMPDSAHFDPSFQGVRGELDHMLTTEARSEPVIPSDGRVLQVATPRPIELDRGGQTEMTVSFSILSGFHVMSNNPSKPNYIRTEVVFDAGGEHDLTIGAPSYPEPVLFELGDETIRTFQGSGSIRVPVTSVKEAAPGNRTLRGSLRYQACTHRGCLFPRTESFQVALSIRPRP